MHREGEGEEGVEAGGWYIALRLPLVHLAVLDRHRVGFDSYFLSGLDRCMILVFVIGSSGGRIFTAAPPPRDFNNVDAEVYSDGEEPERQGIIDIDAVSNQHPSAPTSVYRDRNLKNDKMKGKSKIKEAKEAKKIKKRKNAMGTDMDVDMDLGGVGVKAEPVSPNKETSQLPPMREDDTMLSEDEAQDRDASGRRVRAFARTGGVGQEGEDEEDVNEAQKVDLSESESEDENEDMEGDFVQAEGYVSDNTCCLAHFLVTAHKATLIIVDM